MPRRKKSSRAQDSSQTSVTVSREDQSSNSGNLIEKLQKDLENRQSLVSLVLGVLIVVVLGVLLFNYFNRPSSDLGTSQQADSSQNAQVEDVKKENLPGKYTVKEGDTLFTIAQSYYDDGYKFSEIVIANKLDNADMLVTGQVLEIPKLAQATTNPAASPTTELEAQASPTPSAEVAPSGEEKGIGGAENQTVWGEKITGDTYTVTQGDWLSKISGRAYGDIYSYTKIAQANNITNPDLIEPGMVLKIPR